MSRRRTPARTGGRGERRDTPLSSVRVRPPALAHEACPAARRLAAPADFTAPASPTQFMIVGVGVGTGSGSGSGSGSGDATGEHVASTLAPLRRMFPRMMFVPLELDGPIGLYVRAPKGASK